MRHTTPSILVRTLLCALVCLFLALPLCAQQRQPWQEYLEQTGLAEDIESQDLAERYEDLCELAAHPIDLNHAPREELEQLPLMGIDRLSRLMEYIARVGAIHTWSELTVADIADDRTVGLWRHFAYLGEQQTEERRLRLADALRYAHHEAVGYIKIPCYRRRGDDEGYLGYPYRHWMRYTMTYGQQLKIGLVGAQDAGEPFMAYPNRAGYDYYSFYLQVQNQGWLRRLVVGRYRLRLGAGLIMNTAYTLGKQSVLSSLERTDNMLSGHGSRSEDRYLQGAAATIGLGRHVETTLWASHRLIDATLAADSTSVATLLHTGYHRTQSEIDRRHNTAQTVAGANIAYRCGGWRIGLSGVYLHYSRQLRPDTDPLYRRYAPTGDRFVNASIDYSYLSAQLALSGETAIDQDGGIATLNRLCYTPMSQLSLCAVQRFYSYRYHALLGRSFSEGGQVSNESGLYLGAVWRLARRWAVTAYADYAYFGWARYGIGAPSHTTDCLLEVMYRGQHITWQTRYRIKQRQHDTSDHTALYTYLTHRAQTTLSAQLGAFTTKTLAALTRTDRDGGSTGWLAGEQLSYTYRWLRIDGAVAYFDTDDYDSRIYCYERSLPYSMGSLALYGHGLRYALTLQAALSAHVRIVAKGGTTCYFDRDHISSGLQQIDRSSQTDIELMARLRF